MTDDQLQRELRRSLTAQRPASRDACPSADALLAVAERRGTEDDRLRTINHALTCSECSQELELLRAMHVSRPRSLMQPRTWALASVLVLAVAIGYWRLTQTEGDAALRAGGDAITLVSPQGTVPAAELLTWRPVPNATRYSVELRREDGTLLLQETTSDTTFTVPERVVLPRGGEFYWTVAARLGDGSDLRAMPRRFRIQ